MPSIDVNRKPCFYLGIDRYEVLKIGLCANFRANEMLMKVINLIYEVKSFLIIERDNCNRNVTKHAHEKRLSCNIIKCL